MKGKLLMYAFVFACLLSLFQYVNSKRMFESYQDKITRLKAKEQVMNDSIQVLNKELTALKLQLDLK